MSILLLDKEKGMTSFSAIKQAQKELGFSKVLDIWFLILYTLKIVSNIQKK